MSVGRVYQINVAPEGGVPKRAVPAARLTPDGVEGDRQRNLKYHGGPERAVCLLALEVIEQLQAEGHPIFPGSTGENLTVVGIEWRSLSPGVRLHITPADETTTTPVELEITEYTTPCATIQASFRNSAFGRLSHKHHPGSARLYARVINPGTVRAGDVVTVVTAQST